ncbi:hypothetical protein A3D11_04660 [Candidatus Peribacteria bacterium RIFCSPHIGHO2_02_FULL_49_16]|nr:MAG: hypothetical protein A2880_04225 [Candidatus Peribacteria bacterium RIFCSPHIGHO2_01_FULL_49_38]OGJ58988.1 MAG: hypothetical protein A3D11_04660 [Candidatus Peribacteria bacterium RIFCSPHIGHO2_02_FULL_49_16]
MPTRQELVKNIPSADIQPPSESELLSRSPKEIADKLCKTLAELTIVDTEVTYISEKARDAFRRLEDLQQILDTMREDDESGESENLHQVLREAQKTQIDNLRMRDTKNRTLRLSILELFRGLREKYASETMIHRLQNELDEVKQTLETLEEQKTQQSELYKGLAQNLKEGKESMLQEQEELVKCKVQITSLQNDIEKKEEQIRNLQSQIITLDTATDNVIDSIVEMSDIEQEQKHALKEKFERLAYGEEPFGSVLKEIKHQVGDVVIESIKEAAVIDPAEIYLNQVAAVKRRRMKKNRETLDAKKEKERQKEAANAERHTMGITIQNLLVAISNLQEHSDTVMKEVTTSTGMIESVRNTKETMEENKAEITALRQEFDEREEQLRALIGYDIEDDKRTALENIAKNATVETAKKDAEDMLTILKQSHIWGENRIIRFRPYLLEISFATYEDDDDIEQSIAKELEESGSDVAVHAWSMNIEQAKNSILKQAQAGGRIIAHCMHTRGKLCVLDLIDHDGTLCVSPNSLKDMGLDSSEEMSLATFKFDSFRCLSYQKPETVVNR